ncbi:hypothetical protein N431DRAFT_482286 [Stipitochalara longipes BDJ]|nr:hypothetical protein N431DRAFT_482286 [Stipitochalara longipes BDJ]
MHFSTTLLLAGLVTFTTAQNPFTLSTLTSIAAGTPFNITWAPSTGAVDTITLLLRQGDPTHLSTIQTIAPSIQNTGSYLWTPPSTLVAGTDYAFEIVDDGNTAITNYSNEFSIISSKTVSSAIPSASTASTSPSPSASVLTATTTRRASTSVRTNTLSGSRTSTESVGTNTGSTVATSATGKSAAGSVKVGVELLGVLGAGIALL